MLDDFEQQILDEDREHKMVFTPFVGDGKRTNYYSKIDKEKFYTNKYNGCIVYDTVSQFYYTLVQHAFFRVSGYYQHINVVVLQVFQSDAVKNDNHMLVVKVDEFLETYVVLGYDEYLRRKERDRKREEEFRKMARGGD